MKLYELTEEIQKIEAKLDAWATEHEGDITDCPLDTLLDGLSSDRDVKATETALWTKNLLAESSAIDQEIKTLQGRSKALKNKAERIKQYISMNLPAGYKINTPKVVISWRKSEKVEINCDPERLPEEFQKITFEAKKTELKKAIKAGHKIQDVELIEKQNLQIK